MQSSGTIHVLAAALPFAPATATGVTLWVITERQPPGLLPYLAAPRSPIFFLAAAFTLRRVGSRTRWCWAARGGAAGEAQGGSGR